MPVHEDHQGENVWVFLLRCGQLVLMKKLCVGSKLQCGAWCAVAHSFGDGLGIFHVSVSVPSFLYLYICLETAEFSHNYEQVMWLLWMCLDEGAPVLWGSSVNVLDEEPHTGAVARFHSYHVVLLLLLFFFFLYFLCDCHRVSSHRHWLVSVLRLKTCVLLSLMAQQLLNFTVPGLWRSSSLHTCC